MAKYLPITGLDLKIDQAIIDICKNYNSSSGSTRQVLYVFVLINIIVGMCVINTAKYSFNKHTINKVRHEIHSIRRDLVSEENYKADQDSLKKSFLSIRSTLESGSDSSRNLSEKITAIESQIAMCNEEIKFLEDSLEIKKMTFSTFLRNRLENYDTIRIPFGNSFDVNNLGYVAGLSFILILLILIFTMSRERNNLKIALQATTQRYTESANESEFATYINAYADKDDAKMILSSINYIRRKHHYNFISMNEVFMLPKLEVNTGEIKRSILGTVNMYMLWIPFSVYLIVFLNDIHTSLLYESICSYSWKCPYPAGQILVLLGVEAVFLSIIAYLSSFCTKIKWSISSIYDNFYEADFNYIGQ